MHFFELLWVVGEGGMLLSFVFVAVSPAVWALLALGTWLASRRGRQMTLARASDGAQEEDAVAAAMRLGRKARNLAITVTLVEVAAVVGFTLGNVFAMVALLFMLIDDILCVILIARLTSVAVRWARGFAPSMRDIVTTYAVLIAGSLAVIAFALAITAQYQNIKLW